MKIGLYGGSFNPVHNGHVRGMEKILENKSVEEIWMIPCGKHAFDKELLPAKYRIAMLGQTIDSMPKNYSSRIKLDFTETSTDEDSYTYKTLELLRQKHSTIHDFSIIVGADALSDIHKWKNLEELKQNKFIVLERPGYDCIDAGINKEIIKLNCDISSTDIRTLVQSKKSIHGLVPDLVEEYIIKEKLYTKNVFANPAATATLIVSYDSGIILVKRKHEPFKNYWALPGGYLNYGEESLEEAAVRELEEETNLHATISDIELFEVNSSPSRDPRGHVIDHIYIVNSYSGQLEAKDDATEINIFRKIPENMAFDHADVLRKYFYKFK